MLKNWKKTDKNILNHEKCRKKKEKTIKNDEKSSKILKNLEKK